MHYCTELIGYYCCKFIGTDIGLRRITLYISALSPTPKIVELIEDPTPNSSAKDDSKVGEKKSEDSDGKRQPSPEIAQQDTKGDGSPSAQVGLMLSC